MSNIRLIVGLGNPGKDYEYTRHNLGFLIVRCIAERYKLKFSTSSLTNSLLCETKMDGLDVCLLMPATFVNNSGVAVKKGLEKYKVDLSGLLVICDDLNVDFGQLRLRPQGSDGGHNGLKSIIHHLGSGEFSRLRCGIGSTRQKKDTVDFVLGEFNKQEKEKLDDFISTAADCSLAWLKNGVHQAMDQFNRRKDNGKND